MFHSKNSLIKKTKSQLKFVVESLIASYNLSAETQRLLKKNIFNLIDNDDDILGIDINEVATILVHEAAWNEFFCGNYLIAKNTINPIGDGRELKRMIYGLMQDAVKKGWMTQEEYDITDNTFHEELREHLY